MTLAVPLSIVKSVQQLVRLGVKEVGLGHDSVSDGDVMVVVGRYIVVVTA